LQLTKDEICIIKQGKRVECEIDYRKGLARLLLMSVTVRGERRVMVGQDKISIRVWLLGYPACAPSHKSRVAPQMAYLRENHASSFRLGSSLSFSVSITSRLQEGLEREEPSTSTCQR
jgi:hypothetical protein